VNLPLLQEAVTVIDDLPLLDTADPTGWSTRLTMAADYCAALRGFGVPMPELAEDDLRLRYEALAALHAIKGLGRVRRADIGVSLYSLSTAQLQTMHYRGLLSHLSEAASDPNIRNLAEVALARQPEPVPVDQDSHSIISGGDMHRPPSSDADSEGAPRRRRGRRASRPAGPASGTTPVS
jgi:hypothetical protein